MRSRPAEWAVVGGGLLGMTVAHTLAKRNQKVTLFEGAPECGGLASAWTIGDLVWDRHYHVTLFSDSALRGLLAELNLDSQMRWKKTATGFYHEGSIYPFTTPLDFLRFPVLSTVEKARLATTVWRASRWKDWRALEGITAEEWLTDLSGAGVFRKIWRPLMLAKLGQDYEATAATFMWATIQRLYAARRSGLKEELFGYLPGGYAHMLAEFGKRLKSEGVEIRLNERVTDIQRHSEGGLQVTSANSEGKRFGRVVLTVPAPVAAQVCRGIGEPERAQLEKIRYLGIICASVLLRKPLTQYYVTNILDRTIPFTGLIEMSALVDGAEFGDRGLLYIPRYLRPNHPDFSRSDEDLEREMLSSLFRMHPQLSQEDVLAFKVSRARHVFPLPTLGYSELLPPIDSTMPGLSILNSSHIVNGTLNANETVTLAQREALRLHASLN